MHLKAGYAAMESITQCRQIRQGVGDVQEGLKNTAQEDLSLGARGWGVGLGRGNCAQKRPPHLFYSP